MTESRQTKRRTSIGGAANEAGGEYRASVAAWIVARCLRGLALPPRIRLQPASSVPERVQLEGDRGVDDIDVTTSGGGRVFFQAKRRLGFGKTSLPPVVDQWKLAAAEGLNPETDRLVVACAHPTEEIRRLGEALESRQRAVAAELSGPQAGALDKLHKLLEDIPLTHQEVILKTAVILPLESEEEGVLDAETGELLLDGHVVVHGKGRDAWRYLVREARSLAAKRFGETAEGWMRVLRDAGFDLIADIEGGRSARIEARRLALRRYRGRLIQRANQIDLSALAAQIPPLTFDEAGMSLEVSPEGADSSNRRPPAWAFRRRGRSVVTGLPGGGKTILLARATGFWAERDDWPIPILINLRKFVDRMDDEGTLDSFLRMATEDLEPSDRLLVQEAIRDGLSTGTVAIFLDGLDETRERRHDVLVRLRQMLLDIHPDVEIVLSTRDVAYADARSLGFAALRVQPPEYIASAIEAVLSAYADVSSIPEAHRQSWVGERVGWVEQACDREPTLKESPLMVVLLALLAGERDEKALPQSRANVLKEVVVGVLRRWEARPGRRSDVGSLAGEEATRALLDGFKQVSSSLALNGQASESEVEMALAEYLAGDRWQLPKARAESTARSVLEFWDAAGIFVSRGSPPVVEARVRLFAEVGEALRVSDMEMSDQRSWIREAADDINRHEALSLVATLSSDAADELFAIATRRGSLVLLNLAARVLREGVSVSQERASKLINRLLKRMKISAARAWEATKLIAHIPVPVTIRPEVLRQIAENLPSPHSDIGRALVLLKWGDESKELDDSLLRVLEIEDIPDLEPLEKPRDLRDRVLAATVDEIRRCRAKRCASLVS